MKGFANKLGEGRELVFMGALFSFCSYFREFHKICKDRWMHVQPVWFLFLLLLSVFIAPIIIAPIIINYPNAHTVLETRLQIPLASLPAKSLPDQTKPKPVRLSDPLLPFSKNCQKSPASRATSPLEGSEQARSGPGAAAREGRGCQKCWFTVWPGGFSRPERGASRQCAGRDRREGMVRFSRGSGPRNLCSIHDCWFVCWNETGWYGSSQRGKNSCKCAEVP